ncbi:MAG: alpha/beta fold hydrolase [Sinobacteraceae bacterium]|nr:alpha/beta fold hydrolase [Nevskiaceae bacterium]MBV9316649.1 alpha/beta fold hydrolase [Gammaproteobacteria bacterium]
MSEPLPIVLIPGLLASPRMYAPQIPHLWRCGPVTIADHTRDESMGAIAQRILATAPGRFALVGLSMGGYIAFEMLRQAPQRIARVALLDTSARADQPEQTAMRRTQMALAAHGQLSEVLEQQFPRLVHPARRNDTALRELFALMARDVGAEAFVRQQTAIMGRSDSRTLLGSIRCPTLVLVGDADQLTPPERAAEIAAGIAGACLVTIPDSGHVSTLEQPDEVTRALREWLEG